MDGGGGSRLVEAKFGQGEPRLVGMAATALGGGGEVRDGERGSQLAAEKEMEGREREKSFCCPPADVVLRPAQKEGR